MIHKGTVTLETERLILRRLTLNDAEAMFKNWASDLEVTRFLMWKTHSNVAETEHILSEWIPLYDKPDYYHWTIVPRDFGEPIGTIAAVKQSDDDSMVHIGYCSGKAWWRRGYMTEALKAVVKFFFEEVGINRVESRHDPHNPNSGKVMQKAGLRYEGTSRQSGHNNQGVCDAANYAILAEDYFNPAKAAVTIIPYSADYRDDMLFCFMLAKDALGRSHNGEKPHIKPELLDIEGTYLKRGDVFYLAIDEHGRVVGMLGTETVSPTDLWLKRLFIKPDVKGRGIGSKLLAEVEKFAAGKEITTIHTRFADWYAEAARFYPAKGFVEAEPHEGLRHFVKRLEIKG